MVETAKQSFREQQDSLQTTGALLQSNHMALFEQGDFMMIINVNIPSKLSGFFVLKLTVAESALSPSMSFPH